MKFILFFWALISTQILVCMETPQTPEQKAEWVISNATLPSELKNVIYHQTLLNFKNSPQIKSLHDCLPLTFYKTNFANLQSHAMDPLLALGFIFQDGDDIIFYQPKNSADLVKEQNNIHHFQTIENNLEWTKIDNQKFKIFDKRNSDEVKIEFSQDQQRIPFMNDLITIQNRDLSRGTMCRIAVASYCPFNHKKIYEKKGFICTSETYSNEPFIFFKISTKNNRIYDQLFFYSAVNNSFGFFGIVETGTLPTKTRYFFTSLNEHKKYLEEKNWILDEQQTKLVNDAYSFLDALKEKSDEHTMQNVLKFLEEFKERKDKINILWLTQDELTKQNPFKELHELVKKLSNNNNN